MIEAIRQKILANQYELSQHAVNQSIVRKISITELKETILQGEIIEDYPDDKYSPSCLIFGVTQAKRPLHIHCTYPTRTLIKIISLYEPDSALWLNYKQRRLSDD